MVEDDSRSQMEQTYRRYETETYSAKWSPSIAGNRAILKERVDLAMSIAPPAKPHEVIVDLGAGSSISFPGLFAGAAVLQTDLLLHRLVQARAESSEGMLVCANGAALPYADQSVAGFVVSTLFSSVQAQDVQEAIGREVVRVLVHEGFVLWYDLRLPNPSNKMITALKLGDIRRIFPDLRVESSRSCTLVPPLARRLGRATGTFYRPLARVRFLRSHLLVVLRKNQA